MRPERTLIMAIPFLKEIRIGGVHKKYILNGKERFPLTVFDGHALREKPACRGCRNSGRLTRANTVDHIVAISEGGPAYPGHDGLASYCPACHSAKTARGAEAGAVRSTKPRRGCDASGRPLDPNHPWNGRRA